MPKGRTPTALLALRGSCSAKTRTGEVMPPPAALTPPAWLDAAGLAHWQATAPHLQALRLLTALDVYVWARACALWSRLESLRALLETDGLVLVADAGQGRLHPALRLETQLTAEYVKLAAAFGATPRGRVGLAAAGQPPADDATKARFFRSPPPQP